MTVYVEMPDGSLAPWSGSMAKLEEKLYNLTKRGYSPEVRVL